MQMSYLIDAKLTTYKKDRRSFLGLLELNERRMAAPIRSAGRQSAAARQQDRIVEPSFQPRSATMGELVSKFPRKGYERGSKRLVVGVRLSLILLGQPH